LHPEVALNTIRLILRLVGWLATIILQVAVSFLIIFLFTVIFAGVDTTSRLGWLALLLFIWLGYLIGINLVGYGLLRWAWKTVRPLTNLRLIGTLVGALIPLLILLVIGYSVPIGDTGSRFFDLVTNNWQPILAQVSLFAGILGYYLPGVFPVKPALDHQIDAR
jgi:hypothetical protein